MYLHENVHRRAGRRPNSTRGVGPHFVDSQRMLKKLDPVPLLADGDRDAPAVGGRNDVVAGSKIDVVAIRAGGRADVVRGTTLRS